MLNKNLKAFRWIALVIVVTLMAAAVAPAWARHINEGEGAVAKVENKRPVDDSAARRQAARTDNSRPTAPALQSAPVVAEQAATPAAQPVEVVQAPAVQAPVPEAMPPQAAPEAEHPAEVSFKGTIESINGSMLTIASQTVITDAQTVLQGTLAVGAFVEVEGFVQADLSVLAKTITVEHNAGEDVGEVEFKAPIVSFPDTPPYHGTWIVGDYTLTVDGATLIDTSRALPALGAIAEVKATQKADGTLHATEIKIEDAAEFENEAEFKGTVSDLTGAPAAYDMMVGDRHVTTDNKTQIIGTLANGAFVEVHGSVQPDGSVRANLIQVEDGPQPVGEKEFRSTITSLPTGFIGTWTFANGESIVVDASTVIDESRGPAQVGALAEVKAIAQGAQWVAIRIQIEND